MDMIRGVIPHQREHGGCIFDIVEDKGRQSVPCLLLTGMGKFLCHANCQQGRSCLGSHGCQQVKIVLAVSSSGELRPDAD